MFRTGLDRRRDRCNPKYTLGFECDEGGWCPGNVCNNGDGSLQCRSSYGRTGGDKRGGGRVCVK